MLRIREEPASRARKLLQNLPPRGAMMALPPPLGDGSNLPHST
jgi:hypothetical protein